ncbi:hypothetical protein FRX31_010840, partial [Thalictrum thalictroides]
YKGTNQEDITPVILLLLSTSWTLGVDHNKRVEFSTGSLKRLRQYMLIVLVC